MPNSAETQIKGSPRLGALLAPLAAPLVYEAFVLVFLPDVTPKQERTLAASMTFYLIFTPACYIASFGLGIPLIKVLRRLGKLTFRRVALMGIPLGVVAFAVFLLALLSFGATVEWSGMPSCLGVGCVIGFSVATAYCLIAGVTTRSVRRSK